MAFTVEEGYAAVNDDPYSLKRFIVYNTTTLAEFKNYIDGAGTAAKQNGPISAAAPATESAVPASSSISLYGDEASFDAWNINGNNYIKIRDLAYFLQNSPAMFSVENADGVVIIISNEEYAPVGGEMADGEKGVKIAQPSTASFSVNGNKLQLTVYYINGKCYVKLRDIAQALDFNVTLIEDVIVVAPDEAYTLD